MFDGNGVGFQCMLPIVGGSECLLSRGFYWKVYELVGMVSVRYGDGVVVWISLRCVASVCNYCEG